MGDLTGNLKDNISSYEEDEIKRINKAYQYACKLHEGQLRQSGEPYIIHPWNVACILSNMHADADTICAALLHDTLEDSDITKDIIEKEFNKDIANLVDGVTKMRRLNFSSKQEQNVANTRKIITGITNDVRIILIKLADRLHNMRTLEFKSEFKQKENALETLEIFVPLAYYIGAYDLKSELEDLSLKYLKPELYKKINEERKQIELESSSCLSEMLESIKKILEEKNIPNDIKVRVKNVYGIYKMKCDGGKVSDIHDLLALKILVNDVDECYQVLSLVHNKYHPINGRFKDYICNPKTNMYSSLHTTVFAPDDRLVQTQIRTYDMDKIASCGLASYWSKNAEARDQMQKVLKEKSQFFNSLVDIDELYDDNKEFVSQVKQELFSKKIYVYTGNGDIVELPDGANIIDYAYYIGIENNIEDVIVNEESVAVQHCLKNKDRIYISTNESKYIDSEWAELANTNYVKKRLEKK